MRRGFRSRVLAGLALAALIPSAQPTTTIVTPVEGTTPSALALPEADVWRLSVLSPEIIELSATLTSPADLDPAMDHYRVAIGGRQVALAAVGVWRRVRWAALRAPDRLFDATIVLRLTQVLSEGDEVFVTHAGGLAPGAGPWTATASPDRVSPAIHVSQSGYQPGWPKRALVGAYLGTLGEMPAEGLTKFSVESEAGRLMLEGTLTRRSERGMPGSPAPYQQVREADFSSVDTPGMYRLRVPGLGLSTPFMIGDSTAADLARAYTLGIYHQRCGAPNALPYTRFVHDACHLARAEIPQPGHASSVDARLRASSASATGNPRHTAPVLRGLADALYPAVESGPIDVHGGHHDAGDYGKYVTDSAQFVHALLFAVDALPGAAGLDNLGLPKSGDGVSDLAQLAQWEIEFLLRMQDRDGGFFFLVQPRNRSYEQDVRPDRGDPQVVFPKNTSATAAAVAALAQAASTPAFREASPVTARRALAAAGRGWAFLQRAWSAHGRAGAYQMVTSYGNTFEDRDEIVWAATEWYLATGNADAHRLVLAEFNPLQSSMWRWGWWQMFEGYGAAARSYAFAPMTGRGAGRATDAIHLARCQQAVRAWADAVKADSDTSAFGTSYPDASKRARLAGWYFSENAAFDLMAARALDRTRRYDAAISANMAFATGANPSNQSFVTGVGIAWPREVVSQYAQNDRRALPPGGLLVGNIQQGIPGSLGGVLQQASLPALEGTASPVPMYDRIADVFNTMREATIVDQARALAVAAARMAGTPLAGQAYRSIEGRIAIAGTAAVGQTVTLRFHSAEIDPPDSVEWEWGGEPAAGASLSLRLDRPGTQWIEAEARWRDGRRSVSVTTLEVRR